MKFKMPGTSNQKKHDVTKSTPAHLERPFSGRYPLGEVSVVVRSLLTVAASAISGGKAGLLCHRITSHFVDHHNSLTDL